MDGRRVIEIYASKMPRARLPTTATIGRNDFLLYGSEYKNITILNERKRGSRMKKTVMRALMLYLMTMVFAVFAVTSHNETTVEADNVFDHAVDWEPLQLKNLERNVYYRITLTETQEIVFETKNLGTYGLQIYKPDGAFVGSDDSHGYTWNLEAGTYYMRPEGDVEDAWYRISKPTDKTDLTNDANLIGTPFAGYKIWTPMTTLSSDTCSGDTLKIILSERSHIEFRCDDGSWGNWGDDVYDSYCRKIKNTGIGYLEDEWDAGTYFIKLWMGWKNIYYVLSAPEKATNITINPSDISLSVGETAKLTYSLEPTNCIDTVSYKSTDDKVATVKNDGVITAVGPGTCVVQATTGSEKAALCNVTVTQKDIGRVYIRKISNVKRKKLKVLWDSVDDIDSYQVQCSRNRSFTSPKRKATSGNTAVFKGLKKKKIYYVRVRACRNGSYGEWSTVKKIKIRR